MHYTCEAMSVDGFIAQSLVFQESRFVPTAISSKNARGMTQVMIQNNCEWCTLYLRGLKNREQALTYAYVAAYEGCDRLRRFKAVCPEHYLCHYNGMRHDDEGCSFEREILQRVWQFKWRFKQV